MWRTASKEAVRAGHGGGDYFVARDFVHAIMRGESLPIDVYRAMNYTVPGLVSEQSIAEGGAPVAVPDFRSGDTLQATQVHPRGANASPAAPAAAPPRSRRRTCG